MWYVYQQASKSSMLDEVFIATDDNRIKQRCHELELKVIMTRDDHSTGTDRVAEAASRIDADYYVNIQGDEPMISSEAINAVIEALVDSGDGKIAASNAYTLIDSPVDAVSTNVVKVALAADSTAMIYSRQPIPYPKGRRSQYLRQLGLYAFRKRSLEFFADQNPGPLESAEEVEMLRFLEHGYKVLMVQVADDGIAVDTVADLEHARALMANNVPNG